MNVTNLITNRLNYNWMQVLIFCILNTLHVFHCSRCLFLYLV